MRPDFRSLWDQVSLGSGRKFLRSPRGAVTYKRLYEVVCSFCAEFDRRSVGQGERVVIVTANEAVGSAAFLASLLDGKVPVMLSADSGPGRIAAIRDSVEAALTVTDDSFANALRRSAGSADAMLAIGPDVSLEVVEQGLGSALLGVVGRLRRGAVETVPGLPVTGREPQLPEADDSLAYILFTSGTTKAPSGVEISRKSLMAHLETLTRLFEYGSGSRIFNATPLAHTDGLVQGLLLTVVNGATLLRPGPFTLPGLEEWLNCLSRFEASHFITNPTVLGLIDRFATHDDYFDESHFFGILSSASTLRPDLWQKFESRFNCSIFNLYGMTETVANATYAGRHPEMGALGTIGCPVDCEVRLAPLPGSDISEPGHQEGELQVRGENIFSGYWKDPVRTAATLLDNGWMRTGDVARRREDGSFEIIGRIKTMINTGGQSVAPGEIDEALFTHPSVIDVATVGMEDPEFDEIAVSAVVLDSPVTEAELTDYCRQRLERLKVPKRIIPVQSIPRGDAGKPVLGVLRNMLQPLLHVDASVTATEGGRGTVSADEVCELAASVFRVPVESLDADSSPSSVEGWDSFSQLALVIEAESRFGVSIPASRVASLRTLRDLQQFLNSQL
jgi:long-chain acyl-CoA synthetase